jgi:hypothetical protein
LKKLRPSSIFEKNKVVSHFQKIEIIFQFESYYTPVWLLSQVLLISSCFANSPGRAGRRAAAGYIKIKANLSPVELNLGLAELGKNKAKNSSPYTLRMHFVQIKS